MIEGFDKTFEGFVNFFGSFNFLIFFLDDLLMFERFDFDFSNLILFFHVLLSGM